ncbi:MAG TPA: hypothetical protein DIW37_09420 [Chryseobacterium sp.]|nr:hypothetical protein [Chryseobacterium sp.]
MIQDILYYLILVLCLAFSLFKKKARQNYFWIYFLLVLLYEFFFEYRIVSVDFYASSALIYPLFFLNVYLINFIKKIYILKVCLNSLLIGLGIYYLLKDKEYSINLGVLMVLTYILLSLLWFFNEFRKNDQIHIIKKQFFWISTSLLLWSVFFLFRLIPMYLFDKIDKEFLFTLNNIFQIITILSYIIFLKGLLCER